MKGTTRADSNPYFGPFFCSAQVDSCSITGTNPDGTIQFGCLPSPPPVRLYGSAVVWPRTLDVIPPALNSSSDTIGCAGDNDCLGSYCDFRLNPQVRQ